MKNILKATMITACIVDMLAMAAAIGYPVLILSVATGILILLSILNATLFRLEIKDVNFKDSKLTLWNGIPLNIRNFEILKYIAGMLVIAIPAWIMNYPIELLVFFGANLIYMFTFMSFEKLKNNLEKVD